MTLSLGGAKTENQKLQIAASSCQSVKTDPFDFENKVPNTVSGNILDQKTQLCMAGSQWHCRCSTKETYFANVSHFS